MVEATATPKPLGIKSYGTIPHLEGSRVTPTDKHCHEGQTRIATERCRDKHDVVIVQEKLDGSNVGAALWHGELIALTRAGYRAETSPYEMHWYWRDWVAAHEKRFRLVLDEGERMCGEWLMQAHGTRYKLTHEPFVVFDIMRGHRRVCHDELADRVLSQGFIMPALLSNGSPLSIPRALEELGDYGHHGALDAAEGCVWRVERRGAVDFLAKYVRPDKADGSYLPSVSGGSAVWNWTPNTAMMGEDG